MSQNRTVFPGMEQEDYNQSYQKAGYDHTKAFNGRNERGTVFPGMGQNQNNGEKGANGGASRMKNKPIIGFLYSVSRTGFGEYWPVYIGANTIGRSTKNDIVLSEGTVSEEHATLVVRMMRNSQKIDASISDERSTHGTMVNDESISSTRPLECNNGDIITVGQVYQLYLILINAKELGLGVADNFINISNDISDEEDQLSEDPMFRPSGFANQSRRTNQEPPHFNRGYSSARTQAGTVGMDGKASPSHGGTQGMDDSEAPSFQKGGTQW